MMFEVCDTFSFFCILVRFVFVYLSFMDGWSSASIFIIKSLGTLNSSETIEWIARTIFLLGMSTNNAKLVVESRYIFILNFSFIAISKGLRTSLSVFRGTYVSVSESGGRLSVSSKRLLKFLIFLFLTLFIPSFLPLFCMHGLIFTSFVDYEMGGDDIGKEMRSVQLEFSQYFLFE